MELLQLKYFEAVARHRNYTKASEELFISQPALSSAIKRLEQDLGAPLFIRCKSGVELSEYGNIFLPSARAILAESDIAVKKMGIALRQKSEAVRIIAPANFIRSPLAEKLLYSDHIVTFVIGNISNNELVRSLKNGDAHFAIFNHELKVPLLNSVGLSSHYDYLTVHKSHPLANTESIDIKNLSEIPLIALFRGTSPREELENICKEQQFNPIIAAECPGLYLSLNHELFTSGRAAVFGPVELVKARVEDLSDYRFIKVDGHLFTKRLYWYETCDLRPSLRDEIKNIIIDYYAKGGQ